MPWWSLIGREQAGAAADGAGAAEARWGAEAFALTCLALELAKSDDGFDGSERNRLSADLAHHFDLDPAEVTALIEAAEAYQQNAVETYGLTRKLRDGLDAAQRVVVIETLWRLAYADGVLDAEEFAFMRTVPAALGIENHVSEAAKRRALSALGLTDE